MLVDMVESPVGSNQWTFVDTNGTPWSVYLTPDVTPEPAKIPALIKLKSIQKLKREGFNAREIIEMNNEGMLDG